MCWNKNDPKKPELKFLQPDESLNVNEENKRDALYSMNDFFKLESDNYKKRDELSIAEPQFFIVKIDNKNFLFKSTPVLFTR